MNFNRVICHYAEIGLKKGNRGFFEKKLVDNIKMALQNQAPDIQVKRISGRILIKYRLTNNECQEKIESALKNVFGIAYFSFAVEIEQNIESIKKTAWELLKERKFKTFRISAKRANKKFSLNSQQINEKIGEFIVKKLGKKVNLENSDITVFIEIVEGSAFIYLEKIKGPGGLPTGSSGKGIVLISGGIDSPVASYFAMKRGVETIYLHFHSYPFTSKNSIEKVKQLVNILNKFRQKSKLILIPFAEIQQKIVSAKIDEKLRVILYRRFMFRIAEKIAEKENTCVLITGESIGQVASQTLENIKAVEEAAKIPVIRPLAGFDKEEIINIARNIGTFETSIISCDDTCSLFAPVHPETKADIKSVKLAEKKLDVKNLVAKAVKNIEIKEI
ncbi:tRNA 4-thiouridine(8) synthase ThiI [Candidatus Wolfebacteria bacterium]|nr:tRNA 4-thiouridine(8) synthase ThiI [Candidatus Wolfebacteria bacterium]